MPDPQRVFQLRARYPGIVTEVRKQVGEQVKPGEVLAVVESNESLQRYSIVAPASGVVVARDVNPGVSAGDEALLTVVDLSSVWVELASFQHDLGRIKPRQRVVIRDVDGHRQRRGSRRRNLAAVGSAASQSMTVRVVLPHPETQWRPASLRDGRGHRNEAEVSLAVRRSALQKHDDADVVFEQDADSL